MTDLRYPIGKPQYKQDLTDADRAALIAEFAIAPAQLSASVATLSDQQLDTAYRPQGWTVRQVCHHLPDSHSNGYIRAKLALTEENPVIKPYMEDRWADLDDSRLPVAVALLHYTAIQARWHSLWETIRGEQWQRCFIHPEYDQKFSIDYLLQLYSWHGQHHLAQINGLKSRQGWK